MKADTVQFDLESTSRELLEWLYDRSGAKEEVRVEEFGLERGLDEDDLDLLANDMKQTSWVVGQTAFGPLALKLTAEGVREVQRLRRPSNAVAGSSPAVTQPGASQPSSVIYNIVNPTGPMSWNGTNYSLALTVRTVRANSQTVNHGLDADTILQGVHRLCQLLSEAQGFTEEDQTVLHCHVADIEAEVVNGEADPSKIKKLLTTIQQRLTEAVTKAAATEVVDAARDQLLPLVHELLKAKGLS